MFKIAMVGYGAIGIATLTLLARRTDLAVTTVLAPAARLDAARERIKPWAAQAAVHASLDTVAQRPDLLVECAGHGAIVEHVIPALRAGIPCVIASVGALAAPGLAHDLEQAAIAGGTRVQLLSGAIGAIDALAAARHGGLERVIYTGRKPPLAWSGTPASTLFDLPALTEAAVIFEGSAREAAAAYPKNANVAATLALAGLGLDQTRVQLLADPGVQDNVHHVHAQGAFGEFELTMRGKPLAANPKTSSLTVYSLVRAICNQVEPIVI
ncbi:aspartate dehydrogenase [Achromobacter seleniivolatilans]|uniref:L-aspartate dehydrogenase n=1 Tax=Achromobacter seleniivolatilans TaxID=3047478 RepID=A0ABY9LZC7_9BURK|nr:aspartate dehydrogenase [Achromobacter sp. R39]WMD19288.1 aspartate dehydrogenase [Achromobacter sp. R39]